MELKELRQKKDEELKKLLTENREKLRELRFKVLTNQHKGVRDVRKYKEMISWIQTIQKERLLNPVDTLAAEDAKATKKE